MKKPKVNRRTVLRGAGAMMALPLLDAMSTASALAPSRVAASPVRMGFIFTPNGANMKYWTPEALGKLKTLPQSLSSLEKVKNDIMVLSGLAHRKGFANGDGPGDHARSSASFLTAEQAYKTSGANIKLGQSIDQFAADKIGGLTRFPSLELGCDYTRNSGTCDSGYSCAYVNNISWRTETTPMIKEIVPERVFQRLFGSTDEKISYEEAAKRKIMRKSILDSVKEDAKDLDKKLGLLDRRRLDEYMTGVREIERRVDFIPSTKTQSMKSPKMDIPKGIPRDFGTHIKLMGDMMVLAFQMDITRVSTFMLARAGSNRSYGKLGVSQGHHSISHHQKKEDNLSNIQKIDEYHVQQFAYIIEKMKSIKENDKTLLDNVMLMYGSGISDGNRHNHNELPIILAGRAGGTIKSGRHVRYPKDTPLADLFLAMLKRLDIPAKSFGDSKRRLALR